MATLDGYRDDGHQGTHRELGTMYHPLNNLPVLGTLGVAAVLLGPLARLPIDLGAWILDLLFQWMCRPASRH